MLKVSCSLFIPSIQLAWVSWDHVGSKSGYLSSTLNANSRIARPAESIPMFAVGAGSLFSSTFAGREPCRWVRDVERERVPAFRFDIKYGESGTPACLAA